MRLAGIGLVTFSLLFYMVVFMNATNYDSGAGLVSVAVTVPLIVLLVTIAARAGVVAAAIVIGVAFIVAAMNVMVGHEGPVVMGVAFVASLAPLVGIAMIALAGRGRRRA
jgi:hypothetical protein